MDYMKDLPGQFILNHMDWLKLKDLDKVQDEYQDQIDAFYDRFCSVDDGKASQYIGELIHKDIEENK